MKKKFTNGQCHDCGRLTMVTYTGKLNGLKIYKCKRCITHTQVVIGRVRL